MPNQYRTYAGIGSRETPEDVLHQMREFAYHVAGVGYTLRSGGADGADKTFEIGCDDAGGKKEIYLPWAGFNKNESSLYPPTEEAEKIASGIHPAWTYLKRPAQLLVARNMHQVLGKDVSNTVDFVICWTPDGCESHKTYSRKTGGTGTAICLASLNNAPVFNIRNEGRYYDAVKFVLDKLDGTVS